MIKKLSSSFRDPDGFIFTKNNQVYRAVTSTGKENYNRLIKSGLYKKLISSKLLVKHEEYNDIKIKYEAENISPNSIYKIIRPEIIPFISYPYEWCFSQLKDAALTTLKIQKIALDFGMSLKDCSAFNIQFLNNSPVLIDTLSFENYNENKPWNAYGQFCRHFFAPLALIKYNNLSLNQLQKIFIDGIPLAVCSALLPLKSYFSFGILIHLHLHSKTKIPEISKIRKTNYISRHSLMGMIDSLESAIHRITLNKKYSVWNNYYKECGYKEDYIDIKIQIISQLLDNIKPGTVWDIGSNTGLFSFVSAGEGAFTVSIDADALSTEINYIASKKQTISNILPLCIDLTNPSPAIGWNNKERMTLTERGPADVILALAVIHHLVIVNNLNFDMLADFFSNICRQLIIEFIPKEDDGVKKLLTLRDDIFCDYTEQNFRSEFSKYFKIKHMEEIKGTGRVIYLMQRKRS